MVLHVISLPYCLGIFISFGRYGSMELFEWCVSGAGSGYGYGSLLVVDGLGCVLLVSSSISGILFSSTASNALVDRMYSGWLLPRLVLLASVNRMWYDRLVNGLLCVLQSVLYTGSVTQIEYGVGSLLVMDGLDIGVLTRAFALASMRAKRYNVVVSPRVKTEWLVMVCLS